MHVNPRKLRSIIHRHNPATTEAHPRAAVPTQHTPKGLPKIITSLCPECLRAIGAMIYEDNGKVYIRKRCPDHGEFGDLISSDAKFYLKMEQWTFADEEGIRNPTAKKRADCPGNCGLCSDHLTTACQLNIDLTNRCNLNCPWCFANANASGSVFDATREQIERMLRAARAVEPRRNETIQYSGGEPTIHPDFAWACRQAKAAGFRYVMAATNGLTFAESKSFAEQCKEAGLDALYLQFDGMSDDIYLKTRGRPLAEMKFRAIENARAAGLRVVLVPTIIKGVNDHQLGDILRFGLENLDIMNGISFQPVSFTGRVSNDERRERRFTLADLAWAIHAQTGYLDPYRDWYPLSFVSPLSRLMENISGKPVMTITTHSDCGVGAYVISNGTGTVLPITKFIDMEQVMIEIDRMSRAKSSRIRKPVFYAQLYRTLQKHYLGHELPSDFRYIDFLAAITPTLIRRAAVIGKKFNWKFLIILSMHFQDLYNFNVDRVRRCNVHYAAPNGRIYPFYTYNSGPLYREGIESRFGRPRRSPC